MQDEGSCSLIVCKGSTFPWEWNMGFLSLQREPVSHSTGDKAELLSEGAGEKLGLYHPGQEPLLPPGPAPTACLVSSLLPKVSELQKCAHGRLL